MMKSNENESYQASLTGGIQNDKAYRRFVASSSKDGTDNRAVWNSEMNEAFAALKIHEETGVQDREERMSLPIRLLASLLTLGILGFFVVAWIQGDKRFLVFAGVCLLVRALIAVWKYRRNQKAWLARTKQDT